MTGVALLGSVTLLGGPGGERSFPIAEGGSLRIGRFEGNEIVIPHANVSRFHAVINVGDGGVFLTDLGSRNGTFLGGNRVTTPAPLASGDLIEIGGVALRINLNVGELTVGHQDSGETQALGMKRIYAVILVTDVSGYTALSERLPPQDVTAMLNRFIDIVARIVKGSGGSVEKVIGDALMAVWRGPDCAHGSELTSRALDSALELQVEIERALQEGCWPHQASYPWRFKSSICAGEALEGSVGGAEVREFTVLGDTVNVAFRLNDLCSQMNLDILVSASAAEHLGSRVKYFGDFPLEGREEPMAAFIPA